MNQGQTIFSQLMQWIPHYKFQRIVKRYRGHYKVKSFSCWDQFLCLAFGQLTYRESLRDVVTCLRAREDVRYHMGIRARVSRSTLADANEQRDWRIYCDLAHVLILKARKLYSGEDLDLDLDGAVYALDATTIDLCLSLFPWADFRSTKAGIKLHTLLDLRGSIPAFIAITPAKLHDLKVVDWLLLEPGAFYVMDRGYLGFAWLYRIHQTPAFFVTRAKKNFDFIRHCSRPVTEPGVRSDQIGRLGGFYPSKDYPEKIRRIHYFDTDTAQHLIFLTNNFLLSALIIAQLYKLRWRVELFFKWIKQHLCVKRFYGTSANAVKTQIWTAICVYVLVAIVKKELNLPQSLHSILQVLSVNAFEKVPLHELLTKFDIQTSHDSENNQLTFNHL